jgi:exodeoxyribonuclease VII small subunit
MNAPPQKKTRPGEAAEGSDKTQVVDFERSLARLEEVVRRLDQSNLPLTEAMKLFEEGLQLAQQCQKQLEAAESRVEILLKAADGKLSAAPFRPEGAEEEESS